MSATTNYVRFTFLDNYQALGVLHLPYQEKTAAPVVIILHGLASQRCGSRRGYVMLSRQLAQLGIASIRVDLPGHGDSDGDIHEFSIPDFVQATREIISQALDLPQIDAHAAALFGSSFGGSLALLVAQHFPLLKGIACWAPVIVGSWVSNAFSNQLAHQPVYYEGQLLGQQWITDFQALHVLDQISIFPEQISILHLQGQEDPIISLEQQNLISQFFQNKPNSFTGHCYPQLNHAFPAHDSEIMTRITTWLHQQLIN